ncbi:MAG TPA: hypothetical protein VFG51_00480 [Candidatus Saccharimonadia bacterium]|nr:hypothetical protein [Candidatus Saccharimonadia bacterium]
MPRSAAEALHFRAKLMEVAKTMSFENRAEIVKIFTQYYKSLNSEKNLNDFADEMATFYRLTFLDLGMDNFTARSLIRLILLIGIECGDTIPIAVAYFQFCKLPEGITSAE